MLLWLVFVLYAAVAALLAFGGIAEGRKAETRCRSCQEGFFWLHENSSPETVLTPATELPSFPIRSGVSPTAISASGAQLVEALVGLLKE